MYKRILVPTDGSALSRKAARAAILFAKETGASIVALHVMPAPAPDELEAWAHHDPNYADHRARLFQKFADLYLQFVSAIAASAGVACDTRLVAGSEPYRAIVDTAQSEHCDLVFMAAHGVKGDSAQVPGGETLKVLIHSKVPVLVHKPVPAA
jgi:nucleotide-binding universal stress UspA family protein